MSDTYQADGYYSAVWLVSKGYVLESVTLGKGNKFNFIFKNNPLIAQEAEELYQNREIQDFIKALSTIRKATQSARENPGGFIREERW